MLNSLKFQISAVLLILIGLFSGAIVYTFLVLEHQRTNDTILTLAARLQLTVQSLANQAMRYKEHAPRSFDSYNRDLELYYKDLLAHVETFDMISDAFMHQDFHPMVTGLVDTLRPQLGKTVVDAITDLESNWKRYRTELFQALGPDPAEPRLEWGAEYIMAQNDLLQAPTKRLWTALESWSTQDLARVRQINRVVVALGSLVALAMVAWLMLWVLAPVNRAVKGFRQVAQGDFGLQLEEQGTVEMVQLTRAFNQLSGRLKVLFDLIERLQAGSDLDQTLAFLSREFQGLLRIDWIGILFVTGDGRTARLETAYRDGRREIAEKQVYTLQGTLLERALNESHALHIPAMSRSARDNPAFVFLRSLTAKGMGDAIFLPLTAESQSPIPGVLVFAARSEHCYDPEHLLLLNNIAQLVTHSFGRTLRLTEHTRLAAIGEFASGIAHEIRSPLATIGLALEHLQGLELPPNSAKRVDLAVQESQRMSRLLEDMLLYAKSLNLRSERLSLRELLEQLQVGHQGIADQRGQRLQLDAAADGWVNADRDRITQLWLNLTRNACEAAPDGAVIRWSLRDIPERGIVELDVQNSGEPVAVELLLRFTEPFFTTKSSGTGLGLAIVRRIVEAHGGDLTITSEAGAGTRVTVSLPRSDT